MNAQERQDLYNRFSAHVKQCARNDVTLDDFSNCMQGRTHLIVTLVSGSLSVREASQIIKFAPNTTGATERDSMGRSHFVFHVPMTRGGTVTSSRGFLFALFLVFLLSSVAVYFYFNPSQGAVYRWQDL